MSTGRILSRGGLHNEGLERRIRITARSIYRSGLPSDSPIPRCAIRTYSKYDLLTFNRSSVILLANAENVDGANLWDVVPAAAGKRILGGSSSAPRYAGGRFCTARDGPRRSAAGGAA